jgi:hypothetical protein
MKRFTMRILLGLILMLSSSVPAWPEDTNWGVIPVGQSTNISFAQYDITKNFTDTYSFSLQSGSDASYSVAVTFDVCKSGCGNPDLSYGIFDAHATLISDTGSAVLSYGDYVFKVMGTGMGSGNSVDYSGSMSFFVSSVPEPSDTMLMLTGCAFVIWAVRRRREQGMCFREAVA